MKYSCFLAFACSITLSLTAQNNFIPLRIDSSYSETPGLEGDPLPVITSTAYPYDAQDSLIQQRYSGARLQYSYAPDTVFVLTEEGNTAGTWDSVSRTTAVYTGGKLKSYLLEAYHNNHWENFNRQLFFYNAVGKDTLYLSQDWRNMAWADFYKVVYGYDANGDLIEQNAYYINGNNNFSLSLGKICAYDNNHHKIQEINVEGGINGPQYINRYTWVYGNDDLVDTVRRCNYISGICQDVSATVYNYLGDTITERIFIRDNPGWHYLRERLTFRGPHIYSTAPDSVITYYHWPDSLHTAPKYRQYIHYTDLGNNRVYFRDEVLYRDTDLWERSSLYEAWYHVAGSVHTEGIRSLGAGLSVFPNPGRRGEDINFATTFANSGDYEVLLFDMQGRFVASGQLGDGLKIKAPATSGMYNVVLMSRGRIVGTSKVVVE